MKKSALSILPLLSIYSGLMDGFENPSSFGGRKSTVPEERPTKQEPEWNVLTIPKGCTKETITVTYERNGYEYTVQGDICYKGLKTRSQRKIKLEQQIRNWICQCPDYYLAQHPRVTVKPIEGYERPNTALDRFIDNPG